MGETEQTAELIGLLEHLHRKWRESVLKAVDDTTVKQVEDLIASAKAIDETTLEEPEKEKLRAVRGRIKRLGDVVGVYRQAFEELVANIAAIDSAWEKTLSEIDAVREKALKAGDMAALEALEAARKTHMELRDEVARLRERLLSFAGG
jgi:uncharacterized coiled-coil DUF342 family protein